MKNDNEKLLEQKNGEVLREIGIRNGQIVLDFGCGAGNYTIPAAKIVGRKGRVYALDKNGGKLDKLMRRARLEGIENIVRMETSGEVDIELDDETVDAVLLYDIFWYFPLTDPRLLKLLNEVYRVSRSNALISVYPEHIDQEELKVKIERSGFHLKNRYLVTLSHEDRLEKGQVFNFRKRVR